MVEKKYWKISPSYYARLKNDFIDNNIIALGTDGTGDISKLTDEEIKDKYRKIYGVRGTFYRQLIQFLRELNIGDKILLYGKKSILALGTIKGKYTFNDEFEYPHIREAEWRTILDFDQYPISRLHPKLQNKLMYNRTIVELTDEEWNEIEYSIP